MEEEKDKKGFTGRNFGSKTIPILGELESRTKEGITVATGTIYDYAKEKFQQTINEEYGQQIESLNNSFDEVVQNDIIPRLNEAEEKVDNNIPYTVLYENQYINIPCDAYGNYTGEETSFGTKVRLLRGNVLELLSTDDAINDDIDDSITQYIQAECSGDRTFGDIYITAANLSYISDYLEVPFHVKGESGTTVSGKIIFNKVKQGKSAYEEWKDANPSIENPTINRFLAELKNTDNINGPKYAPDIASAIEDLTIYFIPNSDTTKFDIWLREDSNTITRLAKEIPGDITNYAGIYDVSEDNLDNSNNPTKYSTLSDAIDDIAETAKKGGMTIKYLGTDGKYHQYRYTLADATDSSKFTNEEYWEKIVSENDYSKVATLNDIERRKEIEFSEFGIVNRYIHTDSKAYSGNNSIYIPVEAGKTYIIEPVAHTGNEINTIIVSILTSKSVTNNTSNETLVTSFATGYNSPIVAHRQIRLTMPSDAAYMFVQVTKLGGTVDISPRVFMVEDKDAIIDTKIAILNGVGIPFEFKGYGGYEYPPLRKVSPSSPQTRILLELPVDYIKAISLKEPDKYSYFCAIHDGILPTINFYGISSNGYINTPIDIESEIVNVDGFTPKTLLVVIRKGDGTESLANVQDISEILNIVPKVSDLPMIQTRERTIKTFSVCPITLSPITGRPTKFMANGIGWGHTPRYIRVIGGERYVIKTSSLRFGIFEYDDNQTLINVDKSWIETEEDYEFVPSLSTSFILLAFKSLNNIIEIPNAVAIEGLWGGDDEVFAKRPSDGYDNFIFPVKTDTCKKQSISVSNITEQYKLTTDAGVIHLPANYNEKGTPTPLIIYIHGEADRYKGAVNYPQDASSGFATNNPYAPEWDAAGYAQMDVDLVPDCYNYERTGNSDHLTAGTSDDAACIEAAYEWVINHYNIARDGVYLIGRSRGGQAVMQVLGHYNPDRLPVLCAISNAGANSLINYEVFRQSSADEWALFCDAHGLPNDGRPAYTSKARNNIGALISNSDIAAFLRDNIDVWWNKAATALPLLVQYPEIDREQDKDYPEEGNDFALRLYDLIVRSYKLATSNANYGKEYCDWLNQCVLRSPVPIRFDWCKGDQTQVDWDKATPYQYAKAGKNAFVNDKIGCKAEYRVWPTADNSGTQQNPHWHELMNYLDGDYKLANGVVIHNPSMARLEWLLWCQAHDRRVSGCVNPIEVE